MRIFISKVFLILITILPQVAPTKTIKNLKMPRIEIQKDTKVSIEQIDSQSKTLILSILKEPGVGPNYVSIEDFIRATELEITVDQFLRKKTDFSESVFVIKNKIPLLYESEVNLRKEQANKGPIPKASGKK